MNQTVLVSVIVPVYNVELYLRRCVESILEQTYSCLEIILINDGSTDNSGALCDQLALSDVRIKAYHQSNKGLGGARNAGIELAAGEWICFVDSDDFLHKEYVETLLSIASANNCLIGTCRIFPGAGHSFPKQPPAETLIMDWYKYLLHIHFTEGYSKWPTCISIFHHSIVKQFRFSRHKQSEDTASIHELIYLAKNSPYAITNQYLYYYFQRKQSLSRGARSISSFDTVSAFKQALKFWEDSNEPDVHNLYWDMYFSALLQIATDCGRDLSEEKEKLEIVLNELKSNRDKAIFFAHREICFPVDVERTWKSIQSKGRKYILYGYGVMGQRLLPWLSYFQLPVLEIWDMQCDRLNHMESIAITRPHAGYISDDNICIMVAISNTKVALEVCKMLRDLGYNHFILWPTLEPAFRYAKLKEFCPFMLGPDESKFTTTYQQGGECGNA